MNHIRQHIPAFVSGIEPREAYFNTLEELMQVPFVACWSDTSVARFSKSERHLMAEMKDGKFWVVGYLKDAAAVDLPVWVAPRSQFETEAKP